MALELIGALVIGLTLGMLGSGGSAITVPVLVYVVGHGAKESIAESMAIVGLISLAAAVPYARSHQVDWRSVWSFGVPAMVGMLAGAWLGGVAADSLQLAVFGGVMLGVAAMMLRRPPGDELTETMNDAHQAVLWKIVLEGTIVGAITGFVGVGGGFLIVPALVLLARMPMRKAIGTSLVIIAINAAVGFAKYEHYLLSRQSSVDVGTIVLFVGVGAIGSVIGRSINARLNQEMLKRVFAGFLVVLGGYVILLEGSKLVRPSRPDTQQVVQDSRLTVGVVSEEFAASTSN
ncbi:MAG: sulfite exporter TauE/SafE family protein [Pirellulaceae bacterium]|nr:sulfite exporter TauE/SafE family protein [Planctomycetales bacterium]